MEHIAGITLAIVLLLVTLGGVVQSGVTLRWLLRDLADASLLVFCLIAGSWIMGQLQAGPKAALGSMLAMAMWSAIGFLWWSTVRWNRRAVSKTPLADSVAPHPDEETKSRT